jgi:hypothetical protein
VASDEVGVGDPGIGEELAFFEQAQGIEARLGGGAGLFCGGFVTVSTWGVAGAGEDTVVLGLGKVSSVTVAGGKVCSVAGGRVGGCRVGGCRVGGCRGGGCRLGWLFLRTPAPSGCRNLALLPGIPQELRFPGIPDSNLALFASRNQSRNCSSWQEFLL